LIAALWGVFIWKEFKDAGRQTNALIAAMFFFFLTGIAMIIYAGT
jgi:glucose uptake protein